MGLNLYSHLIKILIVFLLFIVSIYPQPKRHGQGNIVYNLLSVEDHIVPADSGLYICTFSYKIPFNRLIFIKNGSLYTANFLINMEAVNNETEEIFRQSDSRKVAVKEFDKTESPLLSLQGLLNFELKEGRYTVYSSISIEDNKFYPPEFNIDLEDSSKYILEPFIITSYNKDEPVVIGNDNVIPFTDKKMSLAVPSEGSEKVEIKLIQNGKTIISEELNNYFKSNLQLKEIDNDIWVPRDEDGKFNVFILDKNLRKLQEGLTKIEVKYDNGLKKEFQTEVKWLDKPRSLTNVDFSLRILSKIQGEDELDKLSDKFEDGELLNQYWKRFDPDTSTKFNELMELFYKRVDEAAMEFASVDRRNGALSDRGEIYIKYGPADFTERSFTKENHAIEVWKYDKLNKKFIFRDKSGLGNYELVN